MPTYSAYGLGIRSALPLPELRPGEGVADVEITVRRPRDGAAAAAPEGGAADVRARAARLRWGGTGTITVRDGRRIVVHPVPGVDERRLRIALLGPAFAVLLQQRDFLVLHASVVEVAGRAVAFLGDSGFGKSTMAAALHARGHAHLADDIAAVRAAAGGVAVHPGVPQLRLWPDALRALGDEPESLPRLDPGHEKRGRRTDAPPRAAGAVPLAAVYLLALGERVWIEPLEAREAFVALLRFSYGIEWLHEISGSSDFRARAEVARRVPVRRLCRPWRLDVLADVARAVERDVEP